ncbi:hypothetical protein D9M70_529620 [compost metagenome]
MCCVVGVMMVDESIVNIFRLDTHIGQLGHDFGPFTFANNAGIDDHCHVVSLDQDHTCRKRAFAIADRPGQQCFPFDGRNVALIKKRYLRLLRERRTRR